MTRRELGCSRRPRLVVTRNFLNLVGRDEGEATDLVSVARYAHKIGAVLYALWGLLHIWAGSVMLMADPEKQLSLLSTAPLPDQRLPPAVRPIVHAGLSFHAYNLLWFGLFAFVVAVLLNRKNSVAGYWANLAVVGADDVGLLVFLIIPGHLSFADAGLGPLLFSLALVFSTMGVLRGPRHR